MENQHNNAPNFWKNNRYVNDFNYWICEKEKNVRVPTVSDLERKIIRQVEYYYGDCNLPIDRYLIELVRKDPNGWVSMDSMLTFPRLANLSCDPDVIMEALCKSETGLVEVDISRRRIRRKPDRQLPDVHS